MGRSGRLDEPSAACRQAVSPYRTRAAFGKRYGGILSRVLQRVVSRVDLPWWVFVRAARMQGVGPFLLGGLRYYIEDHKQGAFELNAPTSHVLEVTGRPPEDFETIAHRYAAQPQARRTFKNWLRTLADFMRNPASPGYNLDKLDRELDFPTPRTPRLAMADERWIAEHSPQLMQQSVPQRLSLQRALSNEVA